MAKFHINDKGQVKQCRAKKGNCPYGGEGEHYATEEEAFAAIEKKVLAKKEKQEEINYSFLKEFEKIEDEYNKNFAGVPETFYNKDLIPYVEADDYGRTFIKGKRKYLSALQWKKDLARFVTKPNETKKVKPEDLKKMLKQNDIEPISEPIPLSEAGDSFLERYYLSDFKSENGFLMRVKQPELCIKDGVKTIENKERVALVVKDGMKKDTSGYYITNPRSRDRLFSPFENFEVKDDDKIMYVYGMRELLARHRIKTMTGMDLEDLDPKEDRSKARLREISKRLAEKQEEGSNFVQQKKYINDHTRGSVARAFEDKKNQDPIHVKRASISPMLDDFRYIEIDNDVDLNEFAEFEKNYEEIKSFLPPIQEDKRPELRIRYLGKHNAIGVFFPHKNTVCVDVRNSGSFCHEYAHHVDLIMEDNASLKEDFSSILKNYKDKYQGSKAGYYKTPTEVFARSFEVYLYDKKKVRNRLLQEIDTENDAAYKPFDDPKEKQKIFDFFDTMLEKEA